MLGVKPVLGRLFSAAEDEPGRERVALLDYAFWKTQMGADAAIAGRDIQLNGQAYTVVGVLPEGFTFGGDANIGCRSRSIAPGRTIAATITSMCSRA